MYKSPTAFNVTETKKTLLLSFIGAKHKVIAFPEITLPCIPYNHNMLHSNESHLYFSLAFMKKHFNLIFLFQWQGYMCVSKWQVVMIKMGMVCWGWVWESVLCFYNRYFVCLNVIEQKNWNTECDCRQIHKGSNNNFCDYVHFCVYLYVKCEWFCVEPSPAMLEIVGLQDHSTEESFSFPHANTHRYSLGNLYRLVCFYACV